MPDTIYNLRVTHRDFQLHNQPKEKVVKSKEKIRNELKRMKNQIYDFHFLSYGRFYTKNSFALKKNLEFFFC